MKNPKHKKALNLKAVACQPQALRLALDIGTNSIGWALYKLDKAKKPVRIVGSGVRIFPSGRKDKDGTTLNASRREHRLQRRQRDRSLQRKNYLLHLLREHGLFPKAAPSAKILQSLNPYFLRFKGLDEKLNIHHFGRALFHINQKRGFQSNRKSENKKDEKGLISQSVKKSEELMKRENCRTYGEFLYKRLKKMEKARKKSGSMQEHWILSRRAVFLKAKENYVVYADRKMMKREFNLLWDSQANFHDILKDKNLKKKFYKALFFQRPLRKPMVGRCPLTKAKRVSRAFPSFQKFRILKELNNLAYIDTIGKSHIVVKMDKGLEFRNKIIKELFLKKDKVTFKSLEKAFKIFFPLIKKDFLNFNLDSFNRGFLEGDRVSCILRKIIIDWDKWDLQTQDRFLEILNGESAEGDFIKSDDDVLNDLKNFCKAGGLNVLEKHLTSCLNKLGRLPKAYGKYSLQAVRKLLSFLEKGLPEYEAVSRAGFQQPFEKKHEKRDRLPAYQDILSDHCMELVKKKAKNIMSFEKAGKSQIETVFDRKIKEDFNREFHEKGCLSKEFLEKHRHKTVVTVKTEKRISNPTVHIAFNQLRLLVNDIVRVYGKPIQTVVETARDLPLGKKTKDELEKSYKRNQKQNNEARKAIDDFGQENNRSNRIRWLLWKEQKETCIYTGGKISQSAVWTSDLEVDHILPWSKTLDDAFSNKVLVYKSSNQNKSDKTPFEFFSFDENTWRGILERVKNLPKNKRWRFKSEALKNFKDKEGDFLARQLNDTRYISKYAMEYLKCICPEVWSVRGQTTSILRYLLKSGEKNRNDYRNHAYDAVVVGLVDRSFVKKISDIAKKTEGKNKWRLENIGKALKEDIIPWDSFKQDVVYAIGKIVVSHRRRDKKAGAFHKDTAYSVPENIKDFSKPVSVFHYVDILTMAKANKKKIDKILSGGIKAAFNKEFEKNGCISQEFVLEYHKRTGIRKLRIKEKETIIPIKHRNSQKIYKALVSKENYALELYKLPFGKWDGKVINMFYANEKGFRIPPKHVKLMKNDMLYFENKYWRLVKFDKNKRLVFTEHFISGNPNDLMKKQETKEYVRKISSLHGLQKLDPKRIYISPCGKITKSALI